MESVNKISQHLMTIDEGRRNLAAKLTDLNSQLFSKINKSQLNNFKICGIDGGLVKKEYHGAGLILRRAVAVCFEYKDQKLINTQYFPSKTPAPEPIVTGPEFTELEFSIEANLRREEIEIQAAIQATIKFKPDMLILDGSLIVYPSSIPERNSVARETYNTVLALYKRLYSLCEAEGIFLVGVVEDSRGKRFCDIIAEKNTEFEKELKEVNDTLLLHYMLKKGEKTVFFKYSHSEVLPFMQDIGTWSDKIYAFYIKPVEFDRPLRVEFLVNKDIETEATQISEIIQKISGSNRYYCYPSVIIEADARAKLSEQEVSMFKQMISEKIGYNPAFFDLRRDNRPF